MGVFLLISLRFWFSFPHYLEPLGMTVPCFGLASRRRKRGPTKAGWKISQDQWAEYLPTVTWNHLEPTSGFIQGDTDLLPHFWGSTLDIGGVSMASWFQLLGEMVFPTLQPHHRPYPLVHRGSYPYYLLVSYPPAIKRGFLSSNTFIYQSSVEMITTRVSEAAEQHHIRCHHITKAIYIAIFNDRHIIPNITCAVPTCRLQSPICDSWKSRHLHFSPFLRTSPWRSVAIC